MIIKTYTVENMKEAIVRATYELGKDAIIISQQEIKIGKWYNPFKKKKLQVTFALEEKTTPKILVKEPKIEEKKYSIEELIEKNPMLKNTSDRIRSQLLGYLKLNMKDENNLSTEEIVDFMKMAFKENCFEKKLRVRKTNVFVGPTGVGKTTTIAKIAAQESLENKKKVGLITIDTYKIGAVEQLKTYAEILKLPFEVVHRPEKMKEKLEKLKDCDVLLIDTLGTSQRNKEKLNDINLYLENIKNKTNRFLVLSVSTDIETTNSIFQKYKVLDYNGLILTKFDEVTNFNNLWNIIEHNEYPVQYFCHGQNVPDDIEKATLENLIAYSEEIYEDE
ncbi:flagellar biosynthesis protein FlhF [Tissierella creatinophila]|uniref:Flagellar biosynthesis protein FlhF n=1 Tax=Tissierella creatinophila DSM 6911 TaxID=1123403 RepID=A0A1U7M903_TISCR|nr:AAA family ATPase [Tissierella creatinophila]OLS03756.1 flagellar biosynthesis protein FlhF [Tissierella creatinophila DSM 6911]